jgi:predicted HTH transcriptional regulator
MTDIQPQAKLTELLALPNEAEWVEFKKDNTNPQEIGEYLSALSNAAALHRQPFGYIAWGIEDDTHAVIGTTFKPHKTKGKGNEDLEPWLARSLSPRVDFSIHEFELDGKPVVLFRVQAANTAPVAFSGIEYIRVGSHKKPLRDYSEKERSLWAGFASTAFESGVASSGVSAADVVARLDYEAYFRLMQVRLPDTQAKIIDRLADDGIVRKQGDVFDITNLGAILFARDLTQFGRLGRKSLRVIKYKGTGRTQTEREWKDPPAVAGYAAGFEAAVAFINSQLPENEHITEALRKQGRAYPDIAIRELVANTLIHQDLTVTGSGPMVEIFDDRIEFTNPGEPLVDPQRFIDMPPRSRNEALAGMMRRLNICEERGSGIDKVILAIEMFQLPPPDFRVPQGSTRVLLLAPQTFAAMDRAERVRACYQHCVLCWVENKVMTNASLRQRFGIADENYSMASRVIRDTLDEGLIKKENADDSAKKYVPFWA